MKQNKKAIDIKKMRHERMRAVRMHRMAKNGVSPEEIKQLTDDENLRTAMCLVSGSYKIEDGTREKNVTKRDEHHKVIKKEKVQVPNILRGSDAVIHLFKQNGYTILNSGSNYVYIRIGKDDVDKVKELAEQNNIGRMCIYKLTPYKENEDKPKKKPSANNKDKALQAKKARRSAKAYYAEMRPYYAARRKGKISERIKKFNPELAAKIQKWLDSQSVRETRKNKNTNPSTAKSGRKPQVQITTLEKKRQERTKKIARHTAKIEAKKASDRVKMAENAKKKKNLVNKKHPKQTKIAA